MSSSSDRRKGFFRLPCKGCDKRTDCLTQSGCYKNYTTVVCEFAQLSRERPIRMFALFASLVCLGFGFINIFTYLPFITAMTVSSGMVAFIFWALGVVLDE